MCCHTIGTAGWSLVAGSNDTLSWSVIYFRTSLSPQLRKLVNTPSTLHASVREKDWWPLFKLQATICIPTGFVDLSIEGRVRWSTTARKQLPHMYAFQSSRSDPLCSLRSRVSISLFWEKRGSLLSQSRTPKKSAHRLPFWLLDGTSSVYDHRPACHRENWPRKRHIPSAWSSNYCFRTAYIDRSWRMYWYDQIVDRHVRKNMRSVLGHWGPGWWRTFFQLD